MTDLDRLTAAHNARLAAIDPLLPVASVPPTDTPVVVPPAYGVVANDLITVPGAAGVARIEALDPAAFDATWGALTQHQMVGVRVAGDDPAGAMEALLGAWRDRVADGPADVGESSAVILWPSRDTVMTAVLLDRGLSARSALAVRTGGRSMVGGDLPDGLTIRPLAPGDLDAAASLQLAEIAWDAQFGGIAMRSATSGLVRRELTSVAGADPVSAWVAVRAGRLVGLVTVEWPKTATWISRQVGGDGTRVAYLACASVTPGARGAGVGAALAAHAHRELDDAGIETTALHYAALNPLSVPFWSRCGYRPLWTGWEVRPHTALRSPPPADGEKH